MAAIDLFVTKLGSLKVVCFAFVSASASVTQMFKFLVWTYPRALAFGILNHVPGSGSGVAWGQSSISRMMSMFKFLVKVFLDTYFFPNPFK